MIGDILAGDENSRPFTIRRRSVGTYVDGLYQQGSATALNAEGVIIQLKGEQLLRLEEGSRSSDAIRIITQSELRTSRDENRQQADEVVTLDGKLWKVAHVNDWNEIGAFYDAACVIVTGASVMSALYFGASVEDIEDEATLLAELTALPSFGHIAFEADAGAGEFLYYAAPTSFGVPAFKVNGFVGGFEEWDQFQVDGVDLTIFRSVHTGLGNTEVDVQIT